MAIIKYQWPAFTLTYNTETGHTATYYTDGATSGCDPVPEDKFHAEKLGITDKLHRLQHELIHHLIFTEKDDPKGSDIIFRDAHNIALDKKLAELEEWKVTAFQYFMLERNCSDYGAILDLSKEIDIMATKSKGVWLFEAALFAKDLTIVL